MLLLLVTGSSFFLDEKKLFFGLGGMTKEHALRDTFSR